MSSWQARSSELASSIGFLGALAPLRGGSGAILIIGMLVTLGCEVIRLHLSAKLWYDQPVKFREE